MAPMPRRHWRIGSEEAPSSVDSDLFPWDLFLRLSEMNDPSNGVPQQLLPHTHLVSTYRWPVLSTVSTETMVDYLLQAPKITKEVSSMTWTFLDAPPDGTVLLVWQPLVQLGTRFATDGYVWADPEQSTCQPYRGYMVEMYIHRSGYRLGQETVSSHCRRRYRLTPLLDGNPSLPCDPALWIVHYSRADPEYHYPVNRIPMNPQVQAMLQQRRAFQSQGQLVRKEFMLDDRNNWPTVNLPTSHIAQHPQQMVGYPGNIISHMSRSQQQGYMQDPRSVAAHQFGVPPPAKRPRQTPPTHRPGSSSAIPLGVVALNASIEEEEDYVKGDYLDLVTPREISINRYKQHHEWMEEIFSSPYATGQIIPVELGLGRKGELESLTKDFFDAPTSGPPSSDSKAEPKVPGLEPGQAEDFAKRTTAKIAQMQEEMEKMKKLHEKSMAKIRQGSIVLDAEKRLRNAVTNPLEHGKVGQHITPTENDLMIAGIRQQGRIDEIAAEVSVALKKQITIVAEVRCVQKGGLEEKAPPEMDHQMDDIGPSTTSDAQLDPSVIEPIHADDVPSFSEFDDKADWLQGDPDPVTDSLDIGTTPVQLDENIRMSEPAADLEPKSQNGDQGDWVMVDRQHEASHTLLGSINQLENPENTTAEHTDLDKLGTDLPDFNADIPGISTEGFEGNDFDDTVDFSNLDTAGEALAGYGDHNDDMDTDEHLGLVLEDSAFGDAFHHTEANMEGTADGRNA